MKVPIVLVIVALIVSLISGASLAQARDLTFEQRVAAQEAIERVYYAHQDGATRPFQEAVPRDVLERKVRTYLRETAALETLWHTPVTASMLRDEIERMARRTRMPERLRELYAALGNDPFLVEECLARPIVVDRLARNFFAYDATIHAAGRREAERLRDDLQTGRIDPTREHPRRQVADLDAEDAAARTAPARVGEIGPLGEEREAFVIPVLLGRSKDKARVASFTVRKRNWDEWWEESRPLLDDASPSAVASNVDTLPEIASTSCTSDDAWDNGSLSNIVDPRTHHTAVWTGSLMIVWGGSFRSLMSGDRYDPATDTWTPTSSPPFEVGVSAQTAVWTGSVMLVWGGGNFLNKGGRYDPVSDTWTPTSTVNAPAGRLSPLAVWTGSRVIVWGGQTRSGFGNTGGQYDPVTDVWTPTSTLGAPTGFGYTSVWSGSLMIVVGDSSSPGGRYDPLTDTWTPVSAVGAPSDMGPPVAVWTGTTVVVWGRNVQSSVLSSGGRYDPKSDTWLGMTSLGRPTPREHLSAVWTGRLMIVWGGGSNTGGRYDPAADAWTSTTTVNAPSARNDHSAIWTGGLMIAWGGTGPQNLPVDTGGRYDPVTDSWTPTSTTGAPASRARHTAVWTGSFLIVWGGLGNYGQVFGSGGRYDPATDSWTPTSVTNAPSARQDHSAVWTGQHMIVWGGTPVTTTGGRYDPASNTWTPTSTSDAPAGRSRHTAVWSGTEMLVWGGTPDGLSPVGAGGRYNPATDTWQAISDLNEPPARYLHTSVWTGSSMIVWGGYNGTATVNTGGRYDPVMDMWSPTTVTGAPSERSLHTSVWTGSRMVVWGGIEVDVAVDTGGRYDPATDSWTPTSVANAPEGRSSHTAIWDGGHMIVWGGYAAVTGPTSTGGRYDPLADAWLPTATAAAPEGRYGQTAVFTGDHMIVWGGTQLEYQLGTGGRYCVCTESTFYRDGDGDGRGDANVTGRFCSPPPGYAADGSDCNDADASIWGTPGEAQDLFFSDAETLGWSAPSNPGATSLFYDLLRSSTAADFGPPASCVASDTPGSSVTDTTVPPVRTIFFYLVRAQDGCANGQGPLGNDSSGTPRSGRACP